MLQMQSPYGWQDATEATLNSVRSRLEAFESMTWKEILLDGKKANHAVKVHLLCKSAQDRLEEIFGALDVDQLISLRVSGTERIWGLLDGATMKILWWDPDHEVCPSILKHT